VSKL